MKLFVPTRVCVLLLVPEIEPVLLLVPLFVLLLLLVPEIEPVLLFVPVGAEKRGRVKMNML